MLCDRTAVLDGDGVRSALRLAAHPVNAPAAELLGLLESLVLRYVMRDTAQYETSISTVYYKQFAQYRRWAVRI